MFTNKLYKQVDGLAVGSPLGPTLDNVFLWYFEKKLLDECNLNFKPIVYKKICR